MSLRFFFAKTGRFVARGLLGSIFFLTAGTALRAQDLSLGELLPGLKDQAVILDIVARIVERNQQEVWNSSNSRVTIQGRPVGIKLIGANIVVAVQFTPYIRQNGPNILVAQGQIWIDVPNKGMSYQTTMQTISLEYGEQIYFFPLGQARSQDDARIEIMLRLHPYTEEARENPDASQGNETP
jgi:hypothetical protein